MFFVAKMAALSATPPSHKCHSLVEQRLTRHPAAASSYYKPNNPSAKYDFHLLFMKIIHTEKFAWQLRDYFLYFKKFPELCKATTGLIFIHFSVSQSSDFRFGNVLGFEAKCVRVFSLLWKAQLKINCPASRILLFINISSVRKHTHTLLF